MIIVTGGAGFIGSALIAGLNSRGIDNILVVDMLGSDERWKNLRKLQFCDYVEADDFFEMLNAGEVDWDIETVFHLGACSDTQEINCTYLLKNNYDCSKLIANWAIQNEIQFIYASSAATYGDGSKGFQDNQEALQELIPLNMYGYSKQLFDLWLRRAGFLNKVVGLKYFNVFGPNEYHKAEMRSFILKAFEQINNTGKVKLFKSHRDDYKDGQQLRDFLYIKDAVEMTLFFYDNPKLSGIYNIGTGKARSWNDLAGAVFKAMNKEQAIEYIPMPEHLQDKYQYFTQADMKKLAAAGYTNKTIPLEKAVKDYVQNYLTNHDYLGNE